MQFALCCAQSAYCPCRVPDFGKHNMVQAMHLQTSLVRHVSLIEWSHKGSRIIDADQANVSIGNNSRGFRQG